jgi:hypothetical protein
MLSFEGFWVAQLCLFSWQTSIGAWKLWLEMDLRMALAAALNGALSSEAVKIAVKTKQVVVGLEHPVSEAVCE